MLFRIKQEFQHENPLYYYIDTLKVSRDYGDCVLVFDIHEGLEFTISKHKLEWV